MIENCFNIINALKIVFDKNAMNIFFFAIKSIQHVFK